jgi:hypothetical protein
MSSIPNTLLPLRCPLRILFVLAAIGCGSGERTSPAEKQPRNSAEATKALKSPVAVETNEDKPPERKKEDPDVVRKLKELGVDVELHGSSGTEVVLRRDESFAGNALTPEVAALIGKLTDLRIVRAHDTPLADLSFLKPHKKFRKLEAYKIPVTDASFADLKDLPELGVLELRRTFDPPGNITDAGLKWLANSKKLYNLDIPNNAVTDAGLAHLKGLAQLSFLTLSGNRIHGEGLAELKGCPKIFGLILNDNGLDGKFLVHLKDLPALERLAIGGNTVTDDDLAPLEGSKIWDLVLNGDAITAKGLKRLRNFPKLRRLSIVDTAIGDQEMQLLADLPELTDLDISGTKVTDAGLKSIARLPKLTDLQISRLPITDAGIETLMSSGSLKTVWMIGDAKISAEMKKKTKDQKRINFLLPS